MEGVRCGRSCGAFRLVRPTGELTNVEVTWSGTPAQAFESPRRQARSPPWIPLRVHAPLAATAARTAEALQEYFKDLLALKGWLGAVKRGPRKPKAPPANYRQGLRFSSCGGRI